MSASQRPAGHARQAVPRFPAVLGLLILAALPAMAEPGEWRSAFAELQATATSAMSEARVPGVAIGVLIDGQAFSAGLGMANIETGTAVDADTLFPIGSITKTFTALAMMQLVESGKLGLDTPVTQIIPGFHVADPQATQRATVGDLFQHRTGWQGDHFVDTGGGADAMDLMVAQLYFLPQITPFGEVWSYNNVNFQIAGKVLETASGQLYEDYVTQHVLLPLGMTNSGFGTDHLPTQKIAVGHAAVFDDEGTVEVSDLPFPRSIYAAGALRSSANDMLKYARFQIDGLAADGDYLAGGKSLELMQSPLVRGANNEWTGIAWFVEEIAGTTVVSHDGRWIGAMARLVVVPEKRFAIIVLTNSDRGNDVYTPVVEQALRDFPGVERKSPEILPFDRETLAQFVGTYRGNNEDYKLYFEGRQLFIERLFKPLNGVAAFRPLPAMPAAGIGGGRILITSGPNRGHKGELLRDSEGHPDYLRIGHRLYLRDREF